MLNGLLDYIKEIVDSIKERVRNPFTDRNSTPFAGAFIIALVLYNWQLFFSLLSFDSSETRLTKIDIINCYLRRESWMTRIGYPIAIAFGSIVFYYIFNNLSLGLTTFFNRWFKSTILHFTDRSKIITREEFEKVNNRASSSKNNYERMKSELSSSEDERATLDKQLNDLSGKYDQVVSENEKLKKETEIIRTTTTTTTQPPREQFRIVYAKYGAENTYDDVTEIVKKAIQSFARLTVDNKIFEGDPLAYSIKTLFVIYEHSGKTSSITANEAEIIELKDGELLAVQTDLSQRKQSYLKNQNKIGDIFNGLWILTFTAKDEVQDSEPVIVDNDGRYFAHSKHRYYLRTISIDESNKRITFNKVDLQRKLHTKETLTIQDNDLITGTDSKGYRLEYKRQK